MSVVSGKSTKTECQGLIALGSNVAGALRSPEETLADALAALDGESVTVTSISRFYLSPFVPAGGGPDVVNAAAAIRTALAPEALLARLHAIEAESGRERGRRWSSRRLDLDLLDLGGAILPDAETQAYWRCLAPGLQARIAPERLILPHPRLQDRAFVLVPLCDIAPDWRHPVLGQSARDMLASLPEVDRAGITPISGPWPGVSALVKAFRKQ